MPLLSEIKFGSYLSYTPRPETDVAKKSKNVMYALKNEQNGFSKLIVVQIKEKLDGLPFKEFFGPDVALIPAPKSSPIKEGTLWVPSLIAKEMSTQGLGYYYPVLKRIKAVNKSAVSTGENKPKAKDHFETIECDTRPDIPAKIVLIDDVVTRGATLLACASKLRQVFPNTPIFAFSVMRTISTAAEFKSIIEPCKGSIKLTGEITQRRP